MTNLVNRNSLFWEVSPSRIPQILRENDDWVIIRVFEHGTLKDIHDVIELYGEAKVKEVLAREHLKPIAASMAFLFLGIDRDHRYAS